MNNIEFEYMIGQDALDLPLYPITLFFPTIQFGRHALIPKENICFTINKDGDGYYFCEFKDLDYPCKGFKFNTSDSAIKDMYEYIEELHTAYLDGHLKDFDDIEIIFYNNFMKLINIKEM